MKIKILFLFIFFFFFNFLVEVNVYGVFKKHELMTMINLKIINKQVLGKFGTTSCVNMLFQT